MRPFRYSEKKDYRMYGYAYNGRLIASRLDSGIRSKEMVLKALECSRSSTGYIAEIGVVDIEDNTYVRYEVSSKSINRII